MYYTISQGNLIIAQNEGALTRYYADVKPLPEDYEEGKYLVVTKVEEVEVPDFDPETGEITGTHIETKVYYVLDLNPNFEAEKELKEEERIAQLNMTRGDFIEGLILAQGKDEKDIIALIEALPINEIEKKVYINRVNNALDFYRGYPVIDVLCGDLNVSLENMTKFFETKDYNYLKPVVNPDPNTENENVDGEGVEGDDLTHNDPNVTHGEEITDETDVNNSEPIGDENPVVEDIPDVEDVNNLEDEVNNE